MSSFAPGPGLYVPTHDEKTFALLVYVLGIFSGFIAPLVFFLVKRDSKFVAFHALQSLAWHILYLVLLFGGMIAVFISILATVGLSPADHSKPPLAFFGVFAMVWLIGVGGGILNLILGIVYSIKAHKGEWAKFPLIGEWVLRKIVFN